MISMAVRVFQLSQNTISPPRISRTSRRGEALCFFPWAQEKSPKASNSMERVKVYRLDEARKWEDLGTGHVNVDSLEGSGYLGLVVVNEDNNEKILSHRINSDDIYRKPQDHFISWRDPDFSTVLALSFQETAGCSYIWNMICSVRCSLTNETYHNVNSEMWELPPVELSTLPLILENVERGITDQLGVTECVLHDKDFFRKLMNLFRMCEDLENDDGLLLIFKIIRGINNPEIPHIRHRDVLKEHVVYKEVIPIEEPVVLSKIHQNYRVAYLKDVILSRSLDEAVVANLNSIIDSNNEVVVTLLRDNDTFTKELFARLKSPTASIESKKNLVHFLHEFCTLSKNLQMVHRLQLFRDLANEGIFDIIADVMHSEDKKLVLIVTKILILFWNQDPNIWRSYVTRQEGVLFGLLVKNMLIDFEDMHCQLLEFLRSLLETCTSGSQGDTVLEIFYEKHFGELIDVISSSCPRNGDDQMGTESLSSDRVFMNQNCVTPEILLNICHLLCFCVVHHWHRIKCNFLLNNMIDKVLYLTRRREKYLVVAAVRFVRTLVSHSDEHLMNHFVRNNLLKPIVDAFVANGDRYNLLHSAVLDLFEYIRKENLKIFLTYVVDTFWDRLARFENLSSIRALKVNYEQSLEDSALAVTPSTNSGQPQPPVSADPSPRSGGDERAAEFRLKRKSASKTKENEPKRLQLSPEGSRPRIGVFATLCSTLSQALQPRSNPVTAELNNSIEPNL